MPQKQSENKSRSRENLTIFSLPYKYPLWEADNALQLKVEPKWLPLQLKLSSYCSSLSPQLTSLQLMESSQSNQL